MTRVDESRAELCINENFRDGLRDACRIARFAEQRRIPELFLRSRNAGCDDGTAEPKSFQRRQILWSAP